MKSLSQVIVYLAIAAAMLSCKSQQNVNQELKPSHVEIKAVDGKYSFYVNGERFDLKGAGGSGNLDMLQQAGGNSIRTWGPRNGKELLDSAQKYGIMVAMGIPMGQELHHFDYNNEEDVKAQFDKNIQSIEELKNHPNLLCWVVGNELNLSPEWGTPVNPKVYDALKDIVDYIHENDPHHPVTTTFGGVNPEEVKVALEHCPNMDFIALQVYGGLGDMEKLVRDANITIPFAITEYGPLGHWEMPSTEWGREIEEPSAAKASGLYQRIQKGIISDPTGLCLGGYAFLWGQKQERTPTWYGLFLKSGEATASVDELTRYWTGSYPENRAPLVHNMLLNDKNAVDNIYLAPGTESIAKTDVADPNGDPLHFEWVMLKEVVERSQGGAHEVEPEQVEIQIISDAGGELRFKAPAVPGEYRLFCYVRDGKNKAGTANVPFMVR